MGEELVPRTLLPDSALRQERPVHSSRRNVGGNGKTGSCKSITFHESYLFDVVLIGLPFCQFDDEHILSQGVLITCLPVRMATCPQVSPWSGSSWKVSVSSTTSLGSIAKR